MLTPDIQTDALDAQLAIFRATRSYQRYDVSGIVWHYLCSGGGEQCLLLLPGVPGFGEVAFQHIARFERCYRVIAPDYPAAATNMSLLIEGLIEILNHEQVEICSVIGGSYGGMVAQCLVRRAPQRISKVILDHTYLPNRQRVSLYTMDHIILAWLPVSVIHRMLKLGNQCSLLGLSAHQAFWRCYFDELIVRLTKEDYVNRALVCIDFHRNYSFDPSDLSVWSGRLLIIEADDDQQVSLKERMDLKKLYVGAEVYTFHRTGHGAWASEFEAFHTIMASFLQEER